MFKPNLQGFGNLEGLTEVQERLLSGSLLFKYSYDSFQKAIIFKDML
jgi:hypothetical protein